MRGSAEPRSYSIITIETGVKMGEELCICMSSTIRTLKALSEASVMIFEKSQRVVDMKGALEWGIEA